MPDDLTCMRDRWIDLVKKRNEETKADKEKLKEDFRYYINQSLGLNMFDEDQLPEEWKDIDKYMKIEDKDWDMLMFLYEKKKLQIMQELRQIAILGALKEYANGILCGIYKSNSDLNIDNFEHELDDYVLNNW